MVNEREIAAMQEQLQKNGYEGNYERSQPTHPEISAIWIPEFVHIFKLKGRAAGKRAYLWPNEESYGPNEESYALVVEDDSIHSWQDAIGPWIGKKIPKE